jgi:hypothetical protein
VRELLCQAGDLDLANHLGVPRSTAPSWNRRGMPDVVTLDVLDRDADGLRTEVLRLRRRIGLLLAIIRLLFAIPPRVWPSLGSSLPHFRAPDPLESSTLPNNHGE